MDRLPPKRKALSERPLSEHRYRLRRILQADQSHRIYQGDSQPERGRIPDMLNYRQRLIVWSVLNNLTVSSIRVRARLGPLSLALGDERARRRPQEGRQFRNSERAGVRAQGIREADCGRLLPQDDGPVPRVPASAVPGLLKEQKDLLPTSMEMATVECGQYVSKMASYQQEAMIKQASIPPRVKEEKILSLAIQEGNLSRMQEVQDFELSSAGGDMATINARMLLALCLTYKSSIIRRREKMCCTWTRVQKGRGTSQIRSWGSTRERMRSWEFVNAHLAALRGRFLMPEKRRTMTP